MSMKNFFAWVQAGGFNKPRDADDLHRHRLQEANRRREKRDYYSGDRYDISGTQVGTVGGGRIEGGINIGGDVGTYRGEQPTQRREERPQPTPQPTEEKPIPSPGQDDCSAECAEICARPLRAGCAACMRRCRKKGQPEGQPEGQPGRPQPPGGGLLDGGECISTVKAMSMPPKCGGWQRRRTGAPCTPTAEQIANCEGRPLRGDPGPGSPRWGR